MKFGWIKTFVRDTRCLYRVGKTYAHLIRLRRKNASVGQVFDILAKQKRHLPCFYFENKIWSYKMVEEETNRIGNYFSKQGFVKGDVVAVFMTNRVEIIILWLGLSKIGVIAALVNSNLTSDALKHSIEIVKPKGILCDKELLKVLQDSYLDSNIELPVYCTGTTTVSDVSRINAVDLDREIYFVEKTVPVPKTRIKFNDNLMYIYTSGTTGLPKAAIIKHSRFFLVSFGVGTMVGIKPTDIMYTCLPLQHSAAGVIAAGFAILRGIPVVFRSKFSATEFWKDCVKFDITVAQYIGEICRYLLKQPTSPEEAQHKVRMLLGNGLRPEIWTKFQNRYTIPLISEFYASTEGNCTLFNFDGHEGAIGFIPTFMRKIIPIAIIKLDEEDRPVRNQKTGLLEETLPGEPGELVGKIEVGDPIREYQGYAGDYENSQSKIIENVRKKGDKFFRSGDLVVRDNQGYFYFKDRIGDSYRFKGENVSTTQVEGVINKITQIHDVVVFGVKVTHVDGSVGMAVIADPMNVLDIKLLAEGIVRELPEYARPRFLRILKRIENTSTHKLKKSDLKKDGIDLFKIGKDKIYLLENSQFRPLTKDIIVKINSGTIKL